MIGKDIHLGISYCLDNAKRLLDDANFLAKDQRFQTGIPLCILAYEEIGKAAFLYSSMIEDKHVNEQEFSKYNTGVGAHIRKLMEENTDVVKTLETMSEKDFENTKKMMEKAGMKWWKGDRKSAIKTAKADREQITDMFSELKMAFMYTDYWLGRWVSTRNYPVNRLSEIFLFVFIETSRAYYRMRVSSLLYSIGVRKRHQILNEEQRKQLFSNNDTRKLIDVFETVNADYYVKSRPRAIREIRAIVNQLRSIREERKILYNK